MESDALDFILRLSRVFGIAPFVNGTEYRVSRPLYICGKIVVCIINLYYFLIGICYVMSTTDSPVTLDYIQSASQLSTVIIGLIGTFTASERIKRIALWEKDLKQMDLNVPGLQKPSKNMYYTVLFYLFSVTILRILDFANYCREIGTNEQESDITKKIPRTAWNQSESARNNISTITTRKFIENYVHFETLKDNMSYRIRQLAKYYSKICDFVTQTTDTEQYMMILYLIHHMLHLKVNWHKTFLWVSTTESNWYFLIVSLIRSIIHSIALILYVESFHQTHVQMERTFLTINLLKCRKSGDKEVCNELDLFLRVIMSNKTTYSPLGICTLARPLVVKIFGGLVTYVVFIMTYGPEKEDPSSIFLNKETYM